MFLEKIFAGFTTCKEEEKKFLHKTARLEMRKFLFFNLFNNLFLPFREARIKTNFVENFTHISYCMKNGVLLRCKTLQNVWLADFRTPLAAVLQAIKGTVTRDFCSCCLFFILLHLIAESIIFLKLLQIF